MPNDKPQGLTHAERQDVEELSAPRSPVIYEVVRQQGEDELCRPDGSLFWSGVAAGVTIMASVIVQGALRQKLPEAPWREAVSNVGYSVGSIADRAASGLSPGSPCIAESTTTEIRTLSPPRASGY